MNHTINYVDNVWRNCQIVFQMVEPLHSPQWEGLHFATPLPLLFLLISDILVRYQVFFPMTLICISLITNNIKHLLM